MPGQLGLDRCLVADEKQLLDVIKIPGSLNRAIHDSGRRVVSAHGVDGNPHSGYSSAEMMRT